MDLVINKDNKVVTIKFTNDFFIRNGYGGTLHLKNEHNENAKFISNNNYKAHSVLILTGMLREELRHDPRYATKKSYLISSQIEEDALHKVKKYPSSAEVENLIKENEISLTGDWSLPDSDPVNTEFRMQVKDMIYNNIKYQYFASLIEGVRDTCKYQLDEEGYITEEEIEVDEKTAQAQFEREITRYILPRTRTQYTRLYTMPKPFSHWDSRNSFQHFYFVESDDQYDVSIGGSGSSGARETQGRMAHTFLTLETEYGYKIPTYLLFYNKDNELIFLNKSETFRTVNQELVGNYHFSSYAQAEELFKGKLLNYTTDWGSGTLTYTDVDGSSHNLELY